MIQISTSKKTSHQLQLFLVALLLAGFVGAVAADGPSLEETSMKE